MTLVAALRSTEDQLTVQPRGIRADLVIRWSRHCLIGVRLCHEYQLVHRDIAPSNIFLDSEHHARLGDFGVAATVAADGTAPSQGKLRIRAPEAYTDGHVTQQSDLYSVGVTMWRLITGAWPFEAETDAALIDAIVNQRLVRLRDLAPHVPQRLALFVEHAMARQPESRYRHAAEMLDSLARLAPLRRAWVEVAPGPGEDRVWRSFATNTQSPLVVTTSNPGRGTWTVVTRWQHSGRRLRDFCSNGPRATLGSRLRSIFDNA